MSMSSNSKNRNNNTARSGSSNKKNPLNCLCCREDSFNEHDFLNASNSKEHFDKQDSFIIDELKSLKQEEIDLIKRFESFQQKMGQKYDQVLDKLEQIDNTLTRNSKKSSSEEGETKRDEAQLQGAAALSDESIKKESFQQYENEIRNLIASFKTFLTDGDNNKGRCLEKQAPLNQRAQSLQGPVQNVTTPSFRSPPASPLVNPFSFGYHFNTQFNSTSVFDDEEKQQQKNASEADDSSSYRNLDLKAKLFGRCGSITGAVNDLNDLLTKLRNEAEELNASNRLNSTSVLSSPDQGYKSILTNKSPISLEAKFNQCKILNENDV